MSMALLRILGILLVLSTGSIDFAQARSIEGSTGVRSNAMGGAHRGVGSSNDTLTLNPAGMALERRYAVELNYSHDWTDATSRINFSALDSKSGPVAGGLAYQYIRRPESEGKNDLHMLTFGLAYNLGNVLAFGLSTKHLRGAYTATGQTTEDLELYTGDIGIMTQVGRLFRAGFTYHNVVRTDLPDVLPPALGFGLAFNSDVLVVATDLTYELDHEEGTDPAISYHVGAEYGFGNLMAVRLGYLRQPAIGSTSANDAENIVTAGFGYQSGSGAIDISVTRGVDPDGTWGLTAALKFFL